MLFLASVRQHARHSLTANQSSHATGDLSSHAVTLNQYNKAGVLNPQSRQLINDTLLLGQALEQKKKEKRTDMPSYEEHNEYRLEKGLQDLSLDGPTLPSRSLPRSVGVFGSDTTRSYGHSGSQPGPHTIASSPLDLGPLDLSSSVTSRGGLPTSPLGDFSQPAPTLSMEQCHLLRDKAAEGGGYRARSKSRLDLKSGECRAAFCSRDGIIQPLAYRFYSRGADGQHTSIQSQYRCPADRLPSAYCTQGKEGEGRECGTVS